MPDGVGVDARAVMGVRRVRGRRDAACRRHRWQATPRRCAARATVGIAPRHRSRVDAAQRPPRLPHCAPLGLAARMLSSHCTPPTMNHATHHHRITPASAPRAHGLAWSMAASRSRRPASAIAGIVRSELPVQAGVRRLLVLSAPASTEAPLRDRRKNRVLRFPRHTGSNDPPGCPPAPDERRTRGATMTQWLLSLKESALVRLLRWLDGAAAARRPAARRRPTGACGRSILISSFGGQVTMLALPLTAAVLLHATPTQMGLLTAMEIVPFVLFSLPSGVWLDRVRKLPVYVVGETALARRRRQRAARLVDGLAVDALAVRRRLRDRHRLHHRRHGGADRADAGGGARAPGRGACEERAGHLGRRGRRARASPAR